MTKKEFARNWKHFKRNSAALVLLMLGGLGLAACQREVPAVTLPPQTEELLNSVKFGRAELTSLKAEARIEFRGRGRSIRFNSWLLASLPDRFFMEAGGFGFPVSQASVADEAVRIYIPAKSLHYQGSGSRGMAGLLGIQLGSKEWIRLILGYLPEMKGRVTSVKSRKWGREITTEDGKTIRVWSVEKSGWLRSVVESGPRSITIQYGKPMSTSVGSFPSRLSIATPDGSLSVGFKEVLPNPVLSDDKFRLDVPGGVPTRSLDQPDIVVGQ